jgi:polyisoprenoid-binding protein YceI
MFYTMTRWLIVPLCLITLSAGSPGVEMLTVNYSIRPGSSLSINGKTNVNKFNCCSEEYFQDLELRYEVDEAEQRYTFNSQLRLSVSEFVCQKKMMTRDLRKALMADQFPYITVTLFEARLTGKPQVTPDGLVADFITSTDITLAGTCKPVKIPIRVFKSSEDYMRFYGTVKIHLTDFNIEPPTALAGLIEVRDEMEITFDLDVAFSPES